MGDGDGGSNSEDGGIKGGNDSEILHSWSTSSLFLKNIVLCNNVLCSKSDQNYRFSS